MPPPPPPFWKVLEPPLFTILCRYAHSDWQSTGAVLYVIGKSNIMQTWNYIIVLDIKGKQNFKFCYCIHFEEIPANKGANSYKLKIQKIGNCTWIWSYLIWFLKFIVLPFKMLWQEFSFGKQTKHINYIIIVTIEYLLKINKSWNFNSKSIELVS